MAQHPQTSVFATANTPTDQVAELVELGQNGSGQFPESERLSLGIAPDIGYSRAWLIVRRAFIEANAPSLLVDLEAAIKAEFPADKVPAKDEIVRRVISPIVQNLRESELCSWGEIAVRVGLPEAQVRSAFKATNSKKDVGLRIGKGGRFAYGDPTLYLEHRSREGAQIPADFKGKPEVADLLNAERAEERKAERAKRTRKSA